MDSHCEMSEQWIEPLLLSIKNSRKTIAVPVLDAIDNETFEFKPTSQILVGGFDWQLNFKWDLPTDEQLKNLNNPNNTLNVGLETPVMSGGIFTIDKGEFLILNLTP